MYLCVSPTGGHGGWPMDENNNFDYESAKSIANNSPKDYFLYGLGIGKPDEVYECSKLGFNIFYSHCYI